MNLPSSFASPAMGQQMGQIPLGPASFSSIAHQHPSNNMAMYLVRPDHLESQPPRVFPPVTNSKNLSRELPRLTSDENLSDLNLLKKHGLDKSFRKLRSAKQSGSLSSFLPHVPGFIDIPADEENASLLKALATHNPHLRKEILMPPESQMHAFRLNPGPLPASYHYFASFEARPKQQNKQIVADSNTAVGDPTATDIAKKGLRKAEDAEKNISSAEPLRALGEKARTRKQQDTVRAAATSSKPPDLSRSRTAVSLSTSAGDTALNTSASSTDPPLLESPRKKRREEVVEALNTAIKQSEIAGRQRSATKPHSDDERGDGDIEMSSSSSERKRSKKEKKKKKDKSRDRDRDRSHKKS